MGALDSEEVEPGIEKREGAPWLDAGGLPNNEGAEVDGVDADELWPMLKRVFGAPEVAAGAADAVFEASDGFLKP